MGKSAMRYVIPAILAFITGFLLWQIQRERLALDYEVIESAPFPREGGTGRYFVVRLRNAGNKQVQGIDFSISFSGGRIESTTVSEPKLVEDLRKSLSDLRGTIPLMNPGETLAMTVTTLGTPDVSAPKVVARAPGVTASLRSEGVLPPQLPVALIGSAAVALVATVVSFYTSYRASRLSESVSRIQNLDQVTERIEKTGEDFYERLRREQKELEARRAEHELVMKQLEAETALRRREYDQGKPEIAQIVFAILNQAGLGHRIAEFAAGSGDITFWQTGLRLMHWFLVDSSSGDRYIAAAQAIVDQPNVAASSLGFNLYLLAKMEQFRGNSERANRWFALCREKAPLMYEHLMGQDPFFDLGKIRAELLKD